MSLSFFTSPWILGILLSTDFSVIFHSWLTGYSLKNLWNIHCKTLVRAHPSFLHKVNMLPTWNRLVKASSNEFTHFTQVSLNHCHQTHYSCCLRRLSCCIKDSSWKDISLVVIFPCLLKQWLYWKNINKCSSLPLFYLALGLTKCSHKFIHFMPYNIDCLLPPFSTFEEKPGCAIHIDSNRNSSILFLTWSLDTQTCIVQWSGSVTLWTVTVILTFCVIHLSDIRMLSNFSVICSIPMHLSMSIFFVQNLASKELSANSWLRGSSVQSL